VEIAYVARLDILRNEPAQEDLWQVLNIFQPLSRKDVFLVRLFTAENSTRTWDYENDRVSKTQMLCFFSMG